MAASAVMMVSSCAKDLTGEGQLEGNVRLTIKTEATKTAISENEGTYTPTWGAEDALGVYVDDVQDSPVKFTNSSGAGTVASFSGVVTAADGAHDVYAFYPYDAYAGPASTPGEVVLSIPTVQTVAAGSFDPKADILVAQPKKIEVAESAAELSTSFARVGALLKFVVTDNTTEHVFQGQHIKKIVMRNNGEVHFTGKFSVDISSDSNPTFTDDAYDVADSVVVNCPDTPLGTSVFAFVKPCTIPKTSVIQFLVTTSAGAVIDKTIVIPSDIVFAPSCGASAPINVINLHLDDVTVHSYHASGMYLDNTAKNWDVSNGWTETSVDGFDAYLEAHQMTISSIEYVGEDTDWVTIVQPYTKFSEISMTENTGMVRKAYLKGVLNNGHRGIVTLIQAPANTLWDYSIPPDASDDKYGYGKDINHGDVFSFGSLGTTLLRDMAGTGEITEYDRYFDKTKYYRKYIWGNNASRTRAFVYQEMTAASWAELFDGFSIEAIVKYDGNPGDGRRIVLGGRAHTTAYIPGISLEIGGKDNAFDGNWGIYLWTTDKNDNVSARGVSSGIAPTNDETHIVVTVNTSTRTVKFYFNGVLEATETYTGTMNANAYPVVIDGSTPKFDKLSVPGNFNNQFIGINKDAFTGDIYQTRIYKGVLTDAQIAASYNVEVASSYSDPVVF